MYNVTIKLHIHNIIREITKVQLAHTETLRIQIELCKITISHTRTHARMHTHYALIICRISYIRL